MKKVCVILILGILSLSFIFAGNTETDYFYDSSTSAGLTNVQMLMYKCSDSDCTSITQKLQDINSGSSNYLSFEYPTTSTKTYYLKWYLKDCYLPRYYISFSSGSGRSWSNYYYFNKATSCYSPISSFSILNSENINEPIIIDVKADIKASSTTSAFSKKASVYYPPEAIIYAETKVVLKIFNSNDNLVFSDSKVYNIMADTSQDIRFEWTPDIAGDFRAVLTTDVIDCQCQSSSPQSAEKQFSVWDSRPEEQCYTLINDLTAEPSSTEVGELVNIKFKKTSNYADRDSQMTPVPTFVVYEIRDSKNNIVYSFSELLTANSDNYNPKEIGFQWTPNSGGNFKISVTGVSSDNLCQGKINPEDTAFMDLFVESPRTYDVVFYVKDGDGKMLKNAEVSYGGQTGTTDSEGKVVFTSNTGNYDYEVYYDVEKSGGEYSLDDSCIGSSVYFAGSDSSGGGKVKWDWQNSSYQAYSGACETVYCIYNSVSSGLFNFKNTQNYAGIPGTCCRGNSECNSGCKSGAKSYYGFSYPPVYFCPNIERYSKTGSLSISERDREVYVTLKELSEEDIENVPGEEDEEPVDTTEPEEDSDLETQIIPTYIFKDVKNIPIKNIKRVKSTQENNKQIYEVSGYKTLETKDGDVTVETTTKIDAETGEVISTSELIRYGNEVIEEGEDELIVVQNDVLVKIENVENKVVKEEKLLADSLVPLVDVEKIKTPALKKSEKFILKVVKGTYFPNKKLIFETDDYEVVVVDIKDVDYLLENKNVLKVADAKGKEEFIEYEKKVLESETDEDVKALELNKSASDVVEFDELEEYMQEDADALKEGQVSHYQQFVTPDAVKGYVSGLSKEEIYEKVVNFMWMSDYALNEKREYWMKPIEFLEDSPNLATNPIGEIAGDCSEQANTLASMLRASGVDAEDVRVVLGKVNFAGEVGGHAWVELKEDGKWFVLDPSVGAYYDEWFNTKVDREGLSYNYWKYHQYNIVEIWAYYNDQYFTSKSEEVAEGWSQSSETFLRGSVLENFKEVSFKQMLSILIDWFKGLFG